MTKTEIKKFNNNVSRKIETSKEIRNQFPMFVLFRKPQKYVNKQENERNVVN